jgi:hypothetical protein
VLNSTGRLIAADYKNAFEAWQANGDQATAMPKAGYIVRMLQGDRKNNLTSFYEDPDDAAAGMNTWAAIALSPPPPRQKDNRAAVSPRQQSVSRDGILRLVRSSAGCRSPRTVGLESTEQRRA